MRTARRCPEAGFRFLVFGTGSARARRRSLARRSTTKIFIRVATPESTPTSPNAQISDLRAGGLSDLRRNRRGRRGLWARGRALRCRPACASTGPAPPRWTRRCARRATQRGTLPLSLPAAFLPLLRSLPTAQAPDFIIAPRGRAYHREASRGRPPARGASERRCAGVGARSQSLRPFFQTFDARRIARSCTVPISRSARERTGARAIRRIGSGGWGCASARRDAIAHPHEIINCARIARPPGVARRKSLIVQIVQIVRSGRTASQGPSAAHARMQSSN